MASDLNRPPRRRRPLKELRQHRLSRGWSLQDVAYQLIDLGTKTGESNIGVNADMVGRWERGERSPRSPYPKLLSSLYECSAEELGLGRPKTPEWEAGAEMERREVLRGLGVTFSGTALPTGGPESKELMQVAEQASRIEANAVCVIEEILAQARRIDDLLGSRAALPMALTLGNLISRLLKGPQREKVHTSLLSLGAQLSELRGWLAFDMADHRAARTHFKEGLQGAHEAADEALGSYILGYLSILATYSGEPQEGLAFAEASQSRAQRVATETTRSWLATVEAEAWASLRAVSATEWALERAETTLNKAKREDDPSWIYHYGQAGLKSAVGTCYLLLGQTERARAAMGEAISFSRTREVREQALYLTRMAATYVLDEEIEEACRLANNALVVAQDTSSDRALERVLELREQLEPWSDTESVKELDGSLAGGRV